MDASDVEAVISRRFRLERAPTLALTTTGAPIAFSRLRSAQHDHGRSGPVPTEAAFAFQIMLQPLQSWSLRTNQGQSTLPATRAGDAFLFDLSQDPRVTLSTPFDMMRVYIPQAAMDDLAREHGHRPIGGLSIQSAGGSDAILHGLALSLTAAMERPDEAHSLFVDAMALATHAHVVRVYGGASEPPHRRGSLAPWQLRRATDAMSADLGARHTAATLAGECDLSASHFMRAFKQSTGLAPHQWLLRRRVERAKILMRGTTLDLAAISLACGFVDQSHFSRVFRRHETSSPGRWRRALSR